MYPVTRKENVFVEQLATEVVLYDKTHHRAHRLNRTVFAVWENADGSKTVEELAEILNNRLGVPLDRELVLLALEDLQKADLVADAPPETADGSSLSRREMGRKFALAGASASLLPFVASVLAPTPAMARSYNSKTYASELATATVESAKDLPQLLANKNGAWTDYQAGLGDGLAGNKATASGKTSAAQTDFQNAETEFNSMLNALGLPPL